MGSDIPSRRPQWTVFLLLGVLFFGGSSLVILALVRGTGPVNQAIASTQWALNFQFAASARFLVFPAVLQGPQIGFVWIDRSTHIKKVIRADGVNLFSPSISGDDQRLLFVKNKDSNNLREVVRCTIIDWKCQVLVSLDASLRSPIEIGAGNIMFAASYLTKRPDGQERYETFDFFYFDSGTNLATKLTDFKFYSLDAFQYVKPRIYFSALRTMIGNQDSEIVSQEFDEKKKQFVQPQPFEPLFFLKGQTSLSSCSDQCSLIAFLNLSGAGYDLVISNPATDFEVVKTKARGISRPSVIGDDIIVNELFENEYVTSAYRLGRPSEVLERVPNSPESLDKLDAISLSFEK